jgi:hypothetical protein
MSLASTSFEWDADGQRLNVPLKRERELNIPSMKLDMPVISEDMAASLAVALLGHVLFLKSQVPLYVTPLFFFNIACCTSHVFPPPHLRLI